MFVGKSKGIPWNGAPERCFTQVGLAILTNIKPGCKGRPGKNALASCVFSQFTDVKSFMILGPGLIYLSVIALYSFATILNPV